MFSSASSYYQILAIDCVEAACKPGPLYDSFVDKV